MTHTLWDTRRAFVVSLLISFFTAEDDLPVPPELETLHYSYNDSKQDQGFINN